MIVGSILHGAYGDLYEQALCLKHYCLTHPEVEMKLFAATEVRLEAFRLFDLSFSSSFELWTEIEKHPEIERFYQFQICDSELKADVINKLSPEAAAKFDRERNRLPWAYMRDHRLVPAPKDYRLTLSDYGDDELRKVSELNGISEAIWDKPTVSFLWRYRKAGDVIKPTGQRSEEELVRAYSEMFGRLIEKHDCHLLVCGMNVVTTEANRMRTDNKYSSFGLDLPASRVTYLQGLSWPLELLIASRATVSCGNASGFTEALWLIRGKDVVLMDAPPHYLVKAAYRRMPLFHLNNPLRFVSSLVNRSAKYYGWRIDALLRNAARERVFDRGVVVEGR